MPTVARYTKQRAVTRAPHKVRFTKQRLIRRGSTATTLPTLASIAPTTTTAAAAATTITCTGTNFVSGVTKAMVNNVDQPTTYVSATSVTFVFKGPSTAGTRNVLVHNGEKYSTTPRTLTLT